MKLANAIGAMAVAVCMFGFMPSADAAAKTKRLSTKGLEAIAGCARTTFFCKVLGQYRLSDEKSVTGPVPLNRGVTVWGKRGAAFSVGCFGPTFDVAFWVPNRKIVCTQ